jgi:hypothetical protein
MSEAQLAANEALRKRLAAHQARKLAPPVEPPSADEVEAARLRGEIQRLRRLARSEPDRSGWNQRERDHYAVFEDLQRGPEYRRVVINPCPIHEASWQHAQQMLDAREQQWAPFASAWRAAGISSR